MTNKVEKHFDKVAISYDKGKQKYSYYYENIKSLLSSVIPKGKTVLEIGCGTGDLLASLDPNNGYGIDISNQMIKIANKKHKGLVFSTKYPKHKFEYIFMADVIEHLENPYKLFKKAATLLSYGGVFVNTMANPKWEPLLMIWEKLGLKMPEGPHNRITFENIKLIVESVGMKIVKHDYKLLIPVRIPFITDFANKYLEKYLKKYAFIEYFVAVKV